MIVYTAIMGVLMLIGFLTDDESPRTGFLAIMLQLPIYGRVLGWW